MEFAPGQWNIQERKGEGWNTLLATPDINDVTAWMTQERRQPDEYRIVDTQGVERQRFTVLPEVDV